ncbi:hypothetical protein [Planctomicrobium sp. SH664]|uniref:hypothetical protein n=1 Tax=Planctomicrobium sp. SH664 TaxID=3448125 RepID=UPI003F5B39E9
MLTPVPRLILPVLLLCTAAGSGCINSTNTIMPRLGCQPAEYQRRQAQAFDPFPDTKMGPDVGFRPLEFQQQRPEPILAKDNFAIGSLSSRMRLVPQTAPQPAPTLGPSAPLPAPTGYLPPGQASLPPQHYPVSHGYPQQLPPAGSPYYSVPAQYPAPGYPATRYPAASYPAAPYPATQYPATQYPSAQFQPMPYR